MEETLLSPLRKLIDIFTFLLNLAKGVGSVVTQLAFISNAQIPKKSQINGLVRPLISLLERPLLPFLSTLCAKGLFIFNLVYLNEKKHPNFKIAESLLKNCMLKQPDSSKVCHFFPTPSSDALVFDKRCSMQPCFLKTQMATHGMKVFRKEILAIPYSMRSRPLELTKGLSFLRKKVSGLFTSSEFVNYTNLKNKNIFAVNNANILDSGLLRSSDRSVNDQFFSNCAESYGSFFFRKNLQIYFCLLVQMHRFQIFRLFSKMSSVLHDDHLFLFLYPALVNHTFPEFVSLLLCSQLFNLYFSNSSHPHDEVLEEFYKQHQSRAHSEWTLQTSINACIVNPFDKLVIIFENLHNADAFAAALFLSVVRNLVRFRKPLGFRVLNHIFKKYKKSCIFISKIFVREILKALNDELEDLPKELVCESFCLVLTLAYLDDKDVPPEKSILEAVHSSIHLNSEFDEGKRFLFDFKNYKNFQIFVPNSLTRGALVLRDYQLEGIKWLNFLWRYELNGILCDDMGLGKTLQSLITISLQILEVFKYQLKSKMGDNHSILAELAQYAQDRPDMYLKVLQEHVSVVVCPNNLIFHWQKECRSRISSLILKPQIIDEHLLKHGKLSNFLAAQNKRAPEKRDAPNLLIIGYSSLIKNQAFFDVGLGFVVLDEAHMIKNEKTQLSKAVKSLRSKRKLGLTGTPIQNNILELWSIFDFVMPGYLGPKKDFRKEHRALMNMNMMSLELNKMRLTSVQKRKLEFLHAKVLPFIMRREKKDVLKDLPPKIIQDHECVMTQAQRKIYALFQENESAILEDSEERVSLSFAQEMEKTRELRKSQKENVLSTLNNLRKLVNHPFLLGSNPLYADLVASIKKSIPRKNKILEFFFGGKFHGLKSILNSLDYQEDDIFSCKNNSNKLIIFSRYRDCCKLIVDFFARVFPFIKTIHLSNELDLRERAQLVDQFREDKTFKVIVLTTKIGGLGLNLASANIVIMFDHDFNPMNDLQAMDRAHRIGQKKCVNVFRMVTKGTRCVT